LIAGPAYADPFTWTFTGIADAGHWDANDLTGLAYTLRVTTDGAAPNENPFPGFGTWGNLTAEIEIETLGIRTLGNFAFIEQFSTQTSNRLRVRGPNGGPESVLQIPLGVLGDPASLSVFGPVQTLGVGSMFKITDPGIPNPPFELIDLDNATSRITVATTLAPEPATITLFGMGLAVAAIRSWSRRKRN
jgi:hypothetical protein